MDEAKKIIESLGQIIRSLDFAGIALDRARREGSMGMGKQVGIPTHYNMGQTSGQVASAGLDIRRARDGFDRVKAELLELGNLRINSLIHECVNLFMNSAFFTEDDCDKIRRLQWELNEIKSIIKTIGIAEK